LKNGHPLIFLKVSWFCFKLIKPTSLIFYFVFGRNGTNVPPFQCSRPLLKHRQNVRSSFDNWLFHPVCIPNQITTVVDDRDAKLTSLIIYDQM
jgi:hypothetical protein